MKNLLKIAATLCGLLFCFNAFAQIPPIPIDPFLDSWSFDDSTNWTSDENYLPIGYTNIDNVSCWATDDGILDCNVLLLDSTNTAYLNYHLIENNGHTNLALTEGTLWFWFSPDWGSSNLDDGSTGPQDWGRFVDVGAWTTNSSYGWWSLYVSPDGNNIYFSGQTNGVWTNYLNAPISWSANSWHLIGLTYTATNSILYIDDQIATNGLGVTYWPGHEVQTNGFYLGSDYSGTQQARGQFVDFETWNIVFGSDEFSAYYDEMLPELPGMFGGGGFTLDSGVGGYSGGSPASGGGVPSFVDGTNLWLQLTGVTNAGTSQTAYFTLWPRTNATATVYDLYYTTNLATDVNGLNGTNWSWVLRSSAGQTNLTVTNLTTDNNFFRLGLTNDTDGDGLSDAFEKLVAHTDPNNADQNTNGIPDGWEWNYFGSLNLSSNADYDGDGNTIFYDYAHGFDPNVIRFSLQFTNNHFNSSPVYGSVAIHGGTPSFIAILVNDTNLADASWQPYSSSNVMVALSSGNGLYTVQVGLRGLPANARQSWVAAQLTLNNHAPTFIITNPVSGTVSMPLIQLQGMVSASLSQLTYDISNASGIFTNQPGYWQPAFYDTNLLDFTTNTFQCYDIPLTNGLNTITLRATDVAGNTAATNINYTLDYSGDHTAPVLSVLWPTNGASIAGSNVTVQAQVDDVTAIVSASSVDTDGDTNTYSGLVERNGNVWFNNLPLNSGTNSVTIIATDAAGNASTNNLNVIESAVNLTINPIASSQLNRTNAIVTGTIGDTSQKIKVNGVAATVSGNNWAATNVPVSPNGMAGLNVQVTDSGNNPLAAQSTYQLQPAQVVLASYTLQEHDKYSYIQFFDGVWYASTIITRDEMIQWSFGVGGSQYLDIDEHDIEDLPSIISNNFPAGQNGFSATTWEQSLLLGNSDLYSYPIEKFYDTNHQTQAQVMVEPSGQQPVGQASSYIVQAQVTNEDNHLRIPGSQVQIQGTTLMDVTNADGSVWSEALVSAPANASADVTPKASGNYSFTGMRTVNTKKDWQAAVRTEILLDDGGLNIQYYYAGNGFLQNRKYIKAVYAFYQKVYLEQPTEYYWAGLAKLAGAPVYAGLSDAQNASPILTGFQQTIMQMNIDILNDLAWQFEAYRKGGLQALEAIYAGEPNALDLNAITAWRNIDQGIQQNNQTLILSGNEALLSREQQQILPDDYTQLSSFDTTLMSIFAQCPVWSSSSVPYPGRDFSSIMGSGYNVATTADRWNWITAPTYGIWDTWVNLSSDDKSSQVSTLLTTRAVTYSTLPSILFNY
jgi:hypothetical protein